MPTGPRPPLPGPRAAAVRLRLGSGARQGRPGCGLIRAGNWPPHLKGTEVLPCPLASWGLEGKGAPQAEWTPGLPAHAASSTRLSPSRKQHQASGPRAQGSGKLGNTQNSAGFSEPRPHYTKCPQVSLDSHHSGGWEPGRSA